MAAVPQGATWTVGDGELSKRRELYRVLRFPLGGSADFFDPGGGNDAARSQGYAWTGGPKWACQTRRSRGRGRASENPEIRRGPIREDLENLRVAALDAETRRLRRL